MQLDKQQAARFLKALDTDAAAFTFQTFDDNSGRKAASLARVMHGSLDAVWPELERLNTAGAGVFVTVQETDGRGRRAENIKRIRAIFHEDDGDGLRGELPPAQIEVESSPGKRHRYWLVDGLSADDFRGVMSAMVERHGSDPRAKDAARVLRLPGTYHNKGTPHMCRLLTAKRALFGPMHAPEVLAAVPPIVREPTAPRAPTDFDGASVLRALSYVPADSREDWLAVGMALHHATGGDADGFALWDIWSRTETRGVYSPDMQRDTWARFDSGRQSTVTLGTLYHLAGQHGYTSTAIDPAAGYEAATAPTLIELPRDVALKEIIASLEKDLVSGILPYGEEAFIYGDPGAGKTFVGIDLGWHIALGRAWHGRSVRRHPVLYVQLEGETGFRMRMLAARDTLGDPGSWFARLAVPVSLVRDNAGLEGLAVIKRAAAEMAAACGVPVGLVVIDTLSRAIAGQDENAQDAMSDFVQNRMARLRIELGCTVLAVHHTNKTGGMRGSSVLLGAANTVLRCERDKGTPSIRNLIAEKVKDGSEGPLFSYRLEVVQLGAKADMSPVTSCVVVQTAAVDVSQSIGRALLPIVTHGSITVRQLCDALAGSPMCAGETKAAIAKKIEAAFAGGPITVDGVTFVFQPRGESGGIISRVTHN